jgi:hypothetical protein
MSTQSNKKFKLKIKINFKKIDLDNVLYASAFIDKNIIDTQFFEDSLIFISNKKIDKIKIKKSVKTLLDRYPKFADKEHIYYQKKYLRKKINFNETSKKHDLFFKIDNGLYVYKNEFAELIKFLDYFIDNFYAKYFKSKEENYPNMIKLESLKKANHLSSFPEHLIFNFHLNENLENLDTFAKDLKIKKFKQLGDIKFVQNPSTCFHCYAIRENSKINENYSVTSVTKCNRYESNNHKNIERLMEFTLREVIFLGSRNYIEKTRNETLVLTKALAKRWNISGKIISSNDPFFTNDYKSKSFYQLKLNLKYEFKCELPSLNREVSIMSSNVHGDTFAKNFNIKQKENFIQTGCLGFGLERFAMVLISQHGINLKKWPKKLLKDFNDWKKNINVKINA